MSPTLSLMSSSLALISRTGFFSKHSCRRLRFRAAFCLLQHLGVLVRLPVRR